MESPGPTATTNAKGAYQFSYTTPATAGQVVLRVAAKAGTFTVAGKAEKLPALDTATRTLPIRDRYQVTGPNPLGPAPAQKIDAARAKAALDRARTLTRPTQPRRAPRLAAPGGDCSSALGRRFVPDLGRPFQHRHSVSLASILPLLAKSARLHWAEKT